jgi:DNA-directed RNA polymerase I subunit RPA1
MTLNTFHLAGHAAKNVTLGIPRLREIVMTASNHISTPAMTLQLNEEMTEEAGMRFAKAISKLSLAEVVDDVSVSERIGLGVAYSQAKIYDIKLRFFPAKEYTEVYAINVADVVSTLEKTFIPKLQALVRKALGRKKAEKNSTSSTNTAAVPDIGMSVGVIEEASSRPDAERAGDDDDDDGDGDDDDATNAKQKANRGQAISYAENDEEDDAIQTQMEKDAALDDEEDLEDEGIGGSPREMPDDSENEESVQSKHQNARLSASAKDREAKILAHNNDVTRFKFDYQGGSSCGFTLEYAPDTSKVLMLSIVEKALHTSLIQQIPGLDTCTYEREGKIKDPITGDQRTVAVVHTAGVNLKAMQMYGDFINPNKILTNDIAAMLTHYGVEACRSTIIRELSDVFARHGISVDNRHLNLIADYMTRGGGFSPFNRNGLKGSVSPLLKMSFETTLGFLRDAVLDGDWDDLRSPSSRIVIGRTGRVGTGSFDVLTQVPVNPASA